jgi:hypothetical protein
MADCRLESFAVAPTSVTGGDWAQRFDAGVGEEDAGDAVTHYHQHLSPSRMQVLSAAESICRGFA